jgi:folate-dependent tRNA-U54 methylase TrmFO/GidA
MSDKFEEAVKKLREKIKEEYQQGYDYAINLIAEDNINMEDIDSILRYSGDDYQYIRRKLELYEASNKFLEGLIDAFTEVIKHAETEEKDE